jgi:AcrR family transcriptional regulator
VARAKDQKKREQIIVVSKRLFATKGYSAASISDIVGETGYPVGTIYTYFSNKEEILTAIVDEGWQDTLERLEQALALVPSAPDKLSLLVNRFLPALFDDSELIHIVLTETVSLTRLPEKLEKLSAVIFPILREVAGSDDQGAFSDMKSMQAALVVYFLGILNAVRLTESVPLGFDRNDILNFLRDSVSRSMNITLPEPPSH